MASRASGGGRARYTQVAIILHWVVAAFLIFQLSLGLALEDAPRGSIMPLHKSVGVTILLLAVLRLLWRLGHTPPPIVGKPAEKRAASAVHWLFYLVLFAFPLSGLIIVATGKTPTPIMLYGLIPWPHLPVISDLTGSAREAWHQAGENVHGLLVYAVYALFALHLAGALKHHLLDRDGELDKMAPGVRTGAWADPRLIVILLGVVGAFALGTNWATITGATAASRASAPASAPPR